VAEERLVAGWTVGVAVLDHIAAAGQFRVTLEAGKVTMMPFAIHRLRRLTCKYQLYKPFASQTVQLLISRLPARFTCRYNNSYSLKIFTGNKNHFTLIVI